ncbi:PDGLE domain-containing protein [Microbacterium lacus]|uniref:PDGLE domain-containing protein n=1 Tax=Microbacterium lacus TaxID=415217 RepID=UPI000C2BBC9E|nr:PDGLE domain-containing protein [Microbacterium lacus]
MSTSADGTARPAEAAASAPRISTRAFTIGALILCLVIACVVSIAASSSPDGLEYIAGSTGFLDTAQDSATASSPLAEYATAGVEHSWLSVAIAGATGCVVTFGAAWLLGRAAKRRRVGARGAE